MGTLAEIPITPIYMLVLSNGTLKDMATCNGLTTSSKLSFWRIGKVVVERDSFHRLNSAFLLPRVTGIDENLNIPNLRIIRGEGDG